MKRPNPLKYLHVTTHYPPDYKYGGVVDVAAKLQEIWWRLAEFRVVSVSGNPSAVCEMLSGRGECWRSFFLNAYGLSFGAVFGLWGEVANADAVYVNGIVTFPNTLAQLYCVIQKKPFALATHGLTSWSFSHKRWRKGLYFNLISFPLMRRAAFIRVTSQAEEEFLRQKGFANIIFVPNGISASEFSNIPRRAKTTPVFDFVFLGRMSKEKGLDILIPAYRRFCVEFRDNSHRLKLVGPDLQGYLAAMELDFARENMEYIPGLYGDDKIKLLCQAGCLILPSYSENFGNVVAEALACETPVITTTGTPWAEIERIGCGLYVRPEVEDLYQAMKSIYLKSRSEREEMGKRGRAYVLEHFNWEDKARQLFNHLEKIALHK